MSDTSKSEFVTGIGPVQAISLVVGSMIGSGIFIVSADIGRQMNSWGPGGLMLVWVVTGLMTLAGALSYAELAGMMPKAGGQYVFLREGIAPWAGFLYGWTLFTVIQAGTIAAVAVAFARYLGVFFPALTDRLFLDFGTVNLPAGLLADPVHLGLSAQRVVGIVSVAFLTWVNVRGVKQGAGLQTFLTMVKTVALIGLVLLGLTLFRNADVAAANFSNFWGTAPWTSAVLVAAGAAMVGSLFSSDAWNNVTFAAAEVRDPTKNLPRALAMGTGLVTILYILANVAYLNLLPFQGDAAGADALARGIQHATQDRIGAAAAEVMLGGGGAMVMAGLIVISTFGCNAGLILAGPRLTWAMAQDGLFFKKAGELHPTHHTPAGGLWAQALWTSILCLTGTYNQLLDFVIIAALLFYFLTMVALFRLRRTRADLPRPVKAFGYPIVPGLYMVALVGVMITQLMAKPLTAGAGLAIVAIGIPVYLWWARKGVPGA
jgi:APA family basic amino acid/polyamine antiporter